MQRHAARRLHYDFRLEFQGVLKSWAVPKGPSLDPADRVLAVQVEDHPLEYGDFEGVIPAGEYGGGTVMLFDRGQWEPLGSAREALRQGRLKFRLHGQRFKGEWTLVRMATRRDEANRDKGENWLLIKHRDRYAKPGDAGDYARHFSGSVTTGRTMEEIAANADTMWTLHGPQGNEPVVQKTTGVKTATALVPGRLPGARRGLLPKSPQPQLATLTLRPPEGDRWLHEVKLDGYRLLAIKVRQTIRLMTRRGNDWTERFPRIVEALRSLPLKTAVLDGEAVIIARDGTTDFQALQNSLKYGRVEGQKYFLFDLLYADGVDLTACPLVDRKQLLAQSLRSLLSEETPLRYSDHITGHGPEMLRHACRLAIEGVVSKLADSPYTPGRSQSWLKAKCLQLQEFLVIGYTAPRGARQHFGALLLGYYDNRRHLTYCGKVGTGFTGESLAELAERFGTMRTASRPALQGITPAEARGVNWLRPELVAEVEFSQWTSDRRLRQPSFRGIREDIDPDSIRLELPQPSTSNEEGSDAMPPAAKRGRGLGRHVSRGESQERSVAGVHLSHPNKILYPDHGTTKRELAQYYQSVAELILPHLVDRPLALVRCPQGRHGHCFFQKHLSEGLPEAITGIRVREAGEEVQYVSIHNLQGLISLVQLDVLEIHPWGSRSDRIDRPDRLVMDLDPGEGVPWATVIEAAKSMRATLESFNLQAFARLTGGKGVHVVVPLQRRATWPELKQFTRGLAQRYARQDPGRFTAISTKSRRVGKIYVDYLRNNRGATAIGSYSTRKYPGATIATPIGWDELTSELRPNQFNVENFGDRLRVLRRDPWKGFFEVRQYLSRAALSDVIGAGGR